MKSRFKLTVACIASVGIGIAAAQKDTINQLAPYEVTQGFRLLFDSTAASFRNQFADYISGNTTNTALNAGWTMDTTFTDPQRPGVFFRAMKTTAAIPDARTRTTYRDMDLRMDFRNSGNEGVIYRHDVSGGNDWYTGVEFAIDDNLIQANLKVTAGAPYDLYPPIPQTYQTFSTARWNSLRIVVKADSVEHWMNGSKVSSFRYWSANFLAAYNASKWTGYNRFCQTAAGNRTYIPIGYWGWQDDHGGNWQIRRLRILHDSLVSQNRVTLGPPITTGTALFGKSGKAVGYRFEGRPQGLAFVVDPAAGLRFAEIYDLSGRLIRRLNSVAGSEIILERALFRKGLYLMRLETVSGVFQTKALIP